MIDFDRKPTPKSEKEQLLERLMIDYQNKFGVPYVFSIGTDALTMDETIEDIKQRLLNNKRQPEPGYEKDYLY